MPQKLFFNVPKPKINFYNKYGSDILKKIFDELHSKKAVIESDFGDQLDWQRLSNKKACRVWKLTSEDKGLRDKDDWSMIQEKMIDAMIRFEKAFREPIHQLT